MADGDALNIAMVNRDEELIEDIRAGRPQPADDGAVAMLAQLRSELRGAWDVQVTTQLRPPSAQVPSQRGRIKPKRILATVATAGLVAACALIGTTVAGELGDAPAPARATTSTGSPPMDGRIMEAVSLLDSVDRRLSGVAVTGPLPATTIRALERMLDQADALLSTAGHDPERARLATLRARIATLRAATHPPARAPVPATPIPTPSNSAPPPRSEDGRSNADPTRSNDQAGNESDRGAADGDSNDPNSDGTSTGSSDEQGDDSPAGETSSPSSDDGGDGSRSNNPGHRKSGDESDGSSDGGGDNQSGDGSSGGDNQGSKG
jgi:uncharacterized membrane protein YgcG